MSINLFCPSRDRACQLQCMLSSLNKNAPNLFIPHVMYTYSNDNFKAGYEKLKNSIDKMTVVFQEEYNAYDQFTGFLKNYKNHPVVCLITDDSIFYRPTVFTEEKIHEFLSQDDVWAIHGRLGVNITITDYVTNKKLIQPQYQISESAKFIKWDYRYGPDKFDSYFAFPSPFDGSIYRANDLLNLLGDSSFAKIILYEHEICNNGNQQKIEKYNIIAPYLSEVVSMQYNSAHSYGFRSNGNMNVSLDELNKRYLMGEIIDFDNMCFDNVNCAHGEIKFSFIKKEENV